VLRSYLLTFLILYTSICGTRLYIVQIHFFTLITCASNEREPPLEEAVLAAVLLLLENGTGTE